MKPQDKVKNYLISYAIIALFSAGAMMVIAFYVPSSLPVNTDFSAIYYTDVALTRGIHIYDVHAIETMILKDAGALSTQKVFLPRFPYPPWFALSTFYLGLMPIHAAATLWFELNLVMFFFSILLLTDGWSRRLRLFSLPLALIFLPVLGTLSVGQYDFPVLLGAALLTFSLRKDNIPLTALGTALLTFKPHVGGLTLLFVLIYLIARKDHFGQRALLFILIAGAFLFMIGFIADPTWVLNYPGMLLNYRSEGNVVACSECASVPIWLSRLFFDGSLIRAAGIAAALLILLGVTLIFIRPKLMKSPPFLVAFSLLITLLASPYLYNYDFILLLVPLALLLGVNSNRLHKMLAAACYSAPTLAIVFWGRAGNVALVASALVLAVFLYWTARVEN